MEIIRNLYQRIKEEKVPSNVQFPGFYNNGPQDANKKRIIFISPRINRYDMYNMIQPCLYFNHYSERITCVLKGLALDKKELETTYDTEDAVTMTHDEIKRAHMIVFPFESEDLLPQFAQYRRINPKVKIVYCVDFDYYNIPQSHYQYAAITGRIPIIENNIKGMSGIAGADYIMVSRPELREHISQKLGGYPVSAMQIPSLMGNEAVLSDINLKLPPASKKKRRIRIGVFTDQFRAPDFEYHKKIYLWIQKEFAKDVDLFFYGADPYYGDNPQKHPHLRGAHNMVEDNEENDAITPSKIKPPVPAKRKFHKATGVEPEESGKKKKGKTVASKKVQPQAVPVKKGKNTKKAVEPVIVAPEPEVVKSRDNYSRIARKEYRYFFKDFYNLNCDLFLFLYNPENEFWINRPVDIDLLTAMYFEVPVLTNMNIDGFHVQQNEKDIKYWIKNFIQVQLETNPEEENEFSEHAVNLRHQLLPNFEWNATMLTYMEEFFLEPMRTPSPVTVGIKPVVAQPQVQLKTDKPKQQVQIPVRTIILKPKRRGWRR